MALTVTAPPEILLKLKGILKEPYIVQSSINREKISLHMEQMPDKGPTSPTCRGHYTGFAMLYSIYRFCGWCRTNPSLKWEYWSVGYYGEKDTTSKHEAHASWREKRASHCFFKGSMDILRLTIEFIKMSKFWSLCIEFYGTCQLLAMRHRTPYLYTCIYIFTYIYTDQTVDMFIKPRIRSKTFIVQIWVN